MQIYFLFSYFLERIRALFPGNRIELDKIELITRLFDYAKTLEAIDIKIILSRNTLNQILNNKLDDNIIY